MNSLPIQYVNLLASSAVIVFVAYYFLRFNKIEKEAEKKEKKADTEYHQVLDNALERERKILSDTTEEAEHIIQEAKYVSSESKNALTETLQKTVDDIQKEAQSMGQTYLSSYSTSLTGLSDESQKQFQEVAKGFEENLGKQVEEFQTVVKELEESLKKQLSDFHTILLPKMEQELEEYKAARMKETQQMVEAITRRAAEEVLHKSLSPEDHEKLLLDALEKAKKEGVFN